SHVPRFIIRYLDFHGTGPRVKRSREASARPGRTPDLAPRLEHSPSDGFLLTTGARAALEPVLSAPETTTSLIPSRRAPPVLEVAGVERIFANATEQDLDSAWLRLRSKRDALLGVDDWWPDGPGENDWLVERVLSVLQTA